MSIQSDEEREAYARQQTEIALRAEASAIHGAGAEPLADKTGRTLYGELNRLDAAALCLSGGGIRSAAFSLGVLQALAAHPRSADDCAAPCGQAKESLLAKFHYLSTVSGGGYIGGWLSAWRSRAPFWDDARPQDSIWTCLVSRPLGPDHEPPAMGWLRSYSNYLTPKLGILSADSWAAVALVVRNLILNWLIIIPIFCAIILLLKIVAISSDWLTRMQQSTGIHLGPVLIDRGVVQEIFAGAGVACLILALAFVSRNRPTRRPEGDPGPAQGTFIVKGLLPAFLSAVLLAQALASDFIDEKLLLPGWPDMLEPKYALPRMLAAGALCGALVYAAGWIAGAARRKLSDVGSWMAAGAVYGALVALALYWWIQIPDEGIWIFSSVVLHLVFGVPWIIFAQLMAEIMFVGLTSYQPGSDADREWLARAGGWLTVAAIGWLILTFTVFFGAVLAPAFVSDAAQNRIKELSATLAAVFGAATAVLGRSAATPRTGDTKSWSSILSNLALSIFAPLFVLALMIALSYLLDQIILHQTLVPDLFVDWSTSEDHPLAAGEPAPDLDRSQAILRLAVGLVAFFALAVIASRFININRFSLHAMYRNRIIRAFLGASRRRRPDRFTGFDLEDNPRVHAL
jgi:hypothetical protein